MPSSTVAARIFGAVFLLAASAGPASAQPPHLPDWHSKLDPALHGRASLRSGQSRVILRTAGAGLPPSVTTLISQLGGSMKRSLPLIGGVSVTIPNARLAHLASSGLVGHVSLDRTIAGSVERTGATVGARVAREELGVDGSGVGIAIIDSGVTAWHDDL